MTHNSAIHALTNIMESDSKRNQLTPTERKAINHAIAELPKLQTIETLTQQLLEMTQARESLEATLRHIRFNNQFRMGD